MNYDFINNKIVMTEYDSFNIAEILECGQTFRFEKIDANEFQIIAHERVLIIKQNENNTEFYPCSMEDFENIWIKYFDLRRNYREIKENLFENDIVLRDAIEFAPGIRILKQDPWEMLISFIISQNNRIPQIKQVIKNISKKYGSGIHGYNETYAFPNINQLLQADIEGLNACKCGFRSKYIIDAVEKVSSGSIDLSKLEDMPTKELKEALLKIKGVGSKVADCILLFAYGRYEYFPTDVWIKRIMTHFYFNAQETGIDSIHKLAFEKFGKNAGFAQQYLFHYARQFPEIFIKK